MPWRLVIAPRGRSGPWSVATRPGRYPTPTACGGPGSSTRLPTHRAAGSRRRRTQASRSGSPTGHGGAADPAFGPGNSLPLARGRAAAVVHRDVHHARTREPAGAERARRNAGRRRGFPTSSGTTARCSAATCMCEPWPKGRCIRSVTAPSSCRSLNGLRPGRGRGGRAALGARAHHRRTRPPRTGGGRIRRAFPLGDVEITRTVFTDLAPPIWQTTELTGVAGGHPLLAKNARWLESAVPRRLRHRRRRDQIRPADAVRGGPAPPRRLAEQPVLAERLADDTPPPRFGSPDRHRPGRSRRPGRRGRRRRAKRSPGDVLEVRSVHHRRCRRGPGPRRRIPVQAHRTRDRAARAARLARRGPANQGGVRRAVPAQRPGRGRAARRCCPGRPSRSTSARPPTAPADWSRPSTSPTPSPGAWARSTGSPCPTRPPDSSIPARLFPSDEAPLLGFPLNRC